MFEDGPRGLEGRRGSTAPLSQCINPLCSLCSFVLSPLIYVRGPPPFLSSVSPLSEHSLAFYSAASSDNCAPNLFGHSLPLSVPTPLSSPSPLRSGRYDADHDGCVHMTRLTYISTSLGVRPRSPTPPSSHLWHLTSRPPSPFLFLSRD